MERLQNAKILSQVITALVSNPERTFNIHELSITSRVPESHLDETLFSVIQTLEIGHYKNIDSLGLVIEYNQNLFHVTL